MYFFLSSDVVLVHGVDVLGYLDGGLYEEATDVLVIAAACI